MGVGHEGSSVWANQQPDKVADGKPPAARGSDWHPTTVPEHERPFWLSGELYPNPAPPKPDHPAHALYVRLSRAGFLDLQTDERIVADLRAMFLPDCVQIGCTLITNETLSEIYWRSHAAPKFLRWFWLKLHGTKKGSPQ